MSTDLQRAGAAALAVVALFLGIAAAAEAQSRPPRATMTKLQAATSLAPMLARVMPGVVSILITGERVRPITIGVSSGAEEKPAMEPFRSGGSGVIVDAQRGIVITNHHVIVDAQRIDVALSDGRVAEAKLLGTDVATDVAVLQLPLKNLTVVPYGDSDALRIGDFIAAVGNPFGLEGSASQGIVSALMRTDIGYEIFEDFIQVDAAVNPGNSGGALVDIDGRLVGINTATGSARMRTQGISFAIPINMARAIAEELLAKGTFKRGALGIVTEDLNFAMASSMGLAITRGAAVKSVVEGSPAALSGIKKGDVIVSIAGKPVRGHSDYVARVSTTPIGRSLPLEIVSAKGKRTLSLVVSDMTIPPVVETPPMSLRSLDGLQLGTLLPGFKAFGTVNGARVLSVGDGTIGKSGLKPDDVITKVDMTTVRSPQDLFDAAASKMGRIRLEVFRDGKMYWIWLET